MTFTKEQLIEKLKHRISVASEFPESEKAQMDLDLARIALASLEAEPVAYIFKHPAGKLFWALTDESNKDQSDVIPVYAAAPASVVPDNASEPLAYAYKELTPEIMRNHLAVFERYGIAPNDSSTTIQALRIALDGIERSDAMLHGAEPVSQTYKSQHTQFEQVADLYEMQFDDGRTCAFHTDAQKAAQWLQACDGNRVQEYVKLERLRNALSGNSPVTPGGWISCSDRMPDTKTAVLVAREFDRKGDWRMKWATYIPGHPDANDGWIIPGASWIPSHWMPLPEPPQEAK
ncbi:DUF551 domain-containing protein [Escherichia coli]|uniref:DUF551 domain-containing protein n=1 Tax=Escherichia coli TaxID=562 RepID=UPI0017CE6BC2|nr:DUF551 domain-containing protein [Escherichia coli]EHA4541159.1 DUF551 domain-containing protein [Escherichia coli]ELI6023963.1 DUF551 domain-containing protein [Escherichia coli]MBF2921746.1 DUF551 domain-containing protein [Escherichia coli]HCJ9187596.1 DUF551 domain-containing protein [Escherichia coli]